MKKKLVIKDLAKQLGISATTISFILNGKAEEKRISKSLTEKVTKVVEELGYKPNHLAKSFRTGKTNIIGLIVEDISNPFFATIARHIEEKAYKEGYRILYCSTENNIDKTKELISLFKDRHVDGYILTPPKGIEEEVSILMKHNLPVVLFDRFLPELSTNFVVVDNFEATFNATMHLFDQGFKHIAFLTIPSEQTQMQDRMNGYIKAMAQFQKQPSIARIDFHSKGKTVVQQIADFIKAEEHIDAIIFGTNYLGVKGLKALKLLNRQIPGEMGVISFDDHDIFSIYSPTITSIAQPIEEISNQVIKILLRLLGDTGTTQEMVKVHIPATLIVRESSMRK